MPIDPDVAIGSQTSEKTFSWTESDVLLYHLGLGYGARPGDHMDPAVLRYTYDGPDLQVTPAFAIVLPTFHDDKAPTINIPGCEIDLAQVVHGAQEVAVSAPLPTSGTATYRTHVSEIWDKGKAAVIWEEGTATAPDGTELWTTRSSMFVRGEGGWGGDRGRPDRVELPDTTADTDTNYTVWPQQALLYRLCGDRNPLHADPGFAAKAGFPQPILHGRCTYGIVLRELTDGLLGGDSDRVRSFGAKFAGVVFPGETIRVQGWRVGDEVVATATIADGDRAGSPVLGDVVVGVKD